MIKNYKDSSEDEDTQNLSSYSKPDNYPTTNKSPVPSRPVTTRISSSRIFKPEFSDPSVTTPPIDKDFVRYRINVYNRMFTWKVNLLILNQR